MRHAARPAIRVGSPDGRTGARSRRQWIVRRARRWIGALVATLAPLGALATFATFATEVATAAAPATAEGLDLTLYATLLERHTRAVEAVVGTRVDYRALGDDPDWQRLVTGLEAARPSTLDRPERLAFWINAYNVLAIDLVRRHYPVDSIRDIGSFFSPVWKVEVATIEGQPRTLDAIEHEILRPMGDPRIHGAIVCASTSCPSLARTPFRAERLDADLDAATRAWLASPRKGVAIDRARGVVRVSKIFDWFEEDFAATGGVLETIARYRPEDDARWLRGPGRDARIRYFDYDWTLNDLRRE